MGELGAIRSLLTFIKDRALPSAPTADSIADLLRALEKRAISGAVVNSIGARIDAAITSRASATDYTAALALGLERYLNGITAMPIVRPNLASGITLADEGVTAWTFGAYVQLVAASDLAAHVMIGFVFQTNATILEVQVQIATGAAGSEVVIANIPFSRLGTSDQGYMEWWTYPLQIPANARVAMRLASTATAGPANQLLRVKGIFLPRPV